MKASIEEAVLLRSRLSLGSFRRSLSNETATTYAGSKEMSDTEERCACTHALPAKANKANNYQREGEGVKVARPQ